MKRLDNDARATMARVHSLAVAAMNAATADTSPGPDIPADKWAAIPDSLRRRLGRTLDILAVCPPPPPRASAGRSVPAPGGVSRILPG
jgi:hypothetical protein